MIIVGSTTQKNAFFLNSFERFVDVSIHCLMHKINGWSGISNKMIYVSENGCLTPQVIAIPLGRWFFFDWIFGCPIFRETQMVKPRYWLDFTWGVDVVTFCHFWPFFLPRLESRFGRHRWHRSCWRWHWRCQQRHCSACPWWAERRATSESDGRWFPVDGGILVVWWTTKGPGSHGS